MVSCALEYFRWLVRTHAPPLEYMTSGKAPTQDFVVERSLALGSGRMAVGETYLHQKYGQPVQRRIG